MTLEFLVPEIRLLPEQKDHKHYTAMAHAFELAGDQHTMPQFQIFFWQCAIRCYRHALDIKNKPATDYAIQHLIKKRERVRKKL